jgi:hypothetical protein
MTDDGEKCRSCGAEIYWTVTTRGKRMPVDVLPSDEGDLFLFRRPDEPIEAVHMGSTDHRARAGRERCRPRFTSHFATCPSAAQHRRPRR